MVSLDHLHHPCLCDMEFDTFSSISFLSLPDINSLWGIYSSLLFIYRLRLVSCKPDSVGQGKNMQTPEERQDWTGDTWRVFAPVFAIPQSIVYCAAHLIAAVVFRLIMNYLRRFTSSNVIIKRDKAAICHDNQNN